MILPLFLENMGLFEYNVKVRVLHAKEDMTDKKRQGQNHRTGSGFPMGAVLTHGGVQFSTCIDFKRTLELIIFDKAGSVIDHVDMTLHRTDSGTLSVIIEGEWNYDHSYCYEADGVKTSDPFMADSTALRKFGDDKSPYDNAKLYRDDFDWEDDKTPKIAYNNVIAYQLHVRGFTAHSSSKVKNRGRFSGVIEKLPYLKDLGINQIVLMPCYEFDEIIRQRKPQSMENIDYKTDPNAESKTKINFWGFANARYCMPKASYSNGNPVNEFKEMVKAAHRAGIEVVMRFYFPDEVNRAFVMWILNFWAREYHVDGFFLMGSDVPIDIIAADIYLRERKIYNTFFDKQYITNRKYGYNENMAFVNPDFMNVCRKFLKSDENQLSDFLYRQRLNPYDVHIVNYITDYYGFTLRDLVSYDYKHNEDNLEDNNDGENFNYSWNCGVEGASRKKSILGLRMKQIKNALVFLLLAQGVPMICAGDEFLNTQNGNNNPYCQDNETGWIVWKDTKHSREILDFAKTLIRLRTSHPILHPDREFRIMDYAACGFPDLSYHGDMAWNPKFDNHLRHIGIMICGKYARLTRTSEDDSFYMAYNMHWENHTFALPKLSKGLKWSVLILTCDEHAGTIVYKTLEENGDSVTVPDRTVAILTSVEDKNAAGGSAGKVEKRTVKDDRR